MGKHHRGASAATAQKTTDTEPCRLAANAAALLGAGPGFALAAVDPNSTPGFTGKKADGAAALDAVDAELDELQEKLFAASRFGAGERVLLVLQGMDTAGKGGVVRHVIGSVDPQGVAHHAFKAPTEEEKAHDFLWRIGKEMPGPGMIGVFDRSHYEDVLIHKVRGFTSPGEIERRYGAIADFEAQAVANGTRIVKVMLHISKDEQAERLEERLDRPEKHWKFAPSDIDERAFWDEYQRAYAIAIERTGTVAAPWFVVPANHKWYARLAVAHLLVATLRGIDPQWPPATFDVAAEKARLDAS
ncbi:PPK2 family polyphosphate kinase [Paeniglutamicibacter cryotolerans]|uniref:PPK2 family polyphosphate:nucleotide phosphotransferase n=1 Tax=Paeniglutamicibacter cryotolerans TaxID=670079 RepID=A0A839QH87_9MICC|nr:PPK2 family polyphosphate kinase [Paeniglutamicibacter cryotolerans]MBB2993835.1 PPK2 family polyphosphate:nucleotide phosphotransferase [Paeniglutamicibacter cryotolerans]